MVAPIHRTSRRRRSRRAWRPQTVVLAVVACLAAIAGVGSWWVDRPATGFRRVETFPGNAIDDSAAAIANRATYKNSVVPGGVWDAPELADRIARDQVVAEHYRGIDAATMRPQTLSDDQLAFVSYRVGDRIYWTKQRVRINAGETVLTNGDTMIRARCGNCISLEPMLPTSDEEPDLADLDALVGSDRILKPWDLNPVVAEPPVVEDSASSAPAVGGAAGGLALFPLIGGASQGVPSDQTDLIVAPDDFPSYAELVDDPFSSFPDDPFTDLVEDPFTDLLEDPFDDPASPILFFDPGPDDPSDPDDSDPGPEDFPVTLTTQTVPTPVPEPGTFVLVGSAMAGLLARRWRARKQQ